MKRILWALAIVIALCQAVEVRAQENYTISGNLASVLSMYAENAEITAVYVKNGDKIVSDKAKVSSEGIFTLSGQTDAPTEAYLVVDLIVPGGTGQSSSLFVLEKGEITLGDFKKADFKGTPLNDAVYNEVRYLQQNASSSEARFRHISNFIEQYKKTPAVAVILSRLSPNGLFSIEEISDLINASDKCIFSNPTVSAYVRYLPC